MPASITLSPQATAFNPLLMSQILPFSGIPRTQVTESPFMSYSGIIGRSGETPQDRLWTGYDFDSSTTATGFVGGTIAAQFPQLGSNNMNTNLLFLN